MATGSQNLTSYQANKLTNERELYVDLSTTRDSSNKILFDGTTDEILQISGILSTIHGGTGTDSKKRILFSRIYGWVTREEGAVAATHVN